MQVMKDLAIDPSYLQPGRRKILPDSTKLHCRRTPDPVLAQQKVNLDSLLSFPG